MQIFLIAGKLNFNKQANPQPSSFLLMKEKVQRLVERRRPQAIGGRNGRSLIERKR
jgi:hypothetical protein